MQNKYAATTYYLIMQYLQLDLWQSSNLLLAIAAMYLERTILLYFNYCTTSSRPSPNISNFPNTGINPRNNNCVR